MSGVIVRLFQKAVLLTTLLLIVGFGVVAPSFAAPEAELWPRWQANDPHSNIRVDHSAWGRFLNLYLVSGQSGCANLVRYAAVTSRDKVALSRYIARLAGVPMTKLSRAEQKAAWINLYNALTVQTILGHYPVQSIRDISSGWFSSGPWDLKLVQVEGVELSLNDIEHRILRPIWQDNRVHYAVNCASLGCPNLLPEAFTAENSERLLESAARAYVNHPRGADLREGRLYVSSIYEWFQEDFGGSRQGVLDHLRQYAEEPLATGLKRFSGKVKDGYDWSLNE